MNLRKALELRKARSHKYLRREGAQGSYRYIYKEGDRQSNQLDKFDEATNRLAQKKKQLEQAHGKNWREKAHSADIREYDKYAQQVKSGLAARAQERKNFSSLNIQPGKMTGTSAEGKKKSVKPSSGMKLDSAISKYAAKFAKEYGGKEEPEDIADMIMEELASDRLIVGFGDEEIAQTVLGMVKKQIKQRKSSVRVATSTPKAIRTKSLKQTLAERRGRGK